MNREELFELALSTDFPQTEINSTSVRRNFNSLKYGNPNPYGNCCMNVVQMYHPSLWKAHKKGFLSPYEAWYDPILLGRALDNRLKYKGEDLTPLDIRAAFSIAKIAPKVSIFRPAMAKYLICKYLKEQDEIFDPCSGYSGRLLAAAASGKKYIGQDVNEITVAESGRLIRDLELENVGIKVKNSICTRGSYECLFTCPPYSDKENWNQSIEDLTCDEWVEICLKNYDCKKYLFVVDETEKYKSCIVEELQNRSHFGVNTEYVLLI